MLFYKYKQSDSEDNKNQSTGLGGTDVGASWIQGKSESVVSRTVSELEIKYVFDLIAWRLQFLAWNL